MFNNSLSVDIKLYYVIEEKINFKNKLINIQYYRLFMTFDL